MQRIDRTIRTAVCAAVMAAACAAAMGQTAAISAAASLAQQPLAQQIAALVAQPAVARAHWGVVVTTLDGRPIYGLNEGQLFRPDSNAKLFTTAAAMALLGPEKTFETRVVARGGVSTQGVFQGDLELVGGGDANLSGRQLPYMSPAQQPRTAGSAPDPLRYLAELADAVVAKGLREVDGDIVGDDSYYAWEPYAADWAVDDLVWGYGAPVSALAINDDQIEMTIAPGAKRGERAIVTLKPDVPYYTVENQLRSTNEFKNPIVIDRALGSKIVTAIGGGIEPGEPSQVEELAILDPAEYAAIALKAILEARGVKVTGVARAHHWNPGDVMGYLEATTRPVPGVSDGLLAGRMAMSPKPALACDDSGRPNLGPTEAVLATHTSPPLGEDVVVTNKVSQNLHAEMMLRDLGFVFGCWGSIRKGAALERQFLQHIGIDGGDFVFYDGSGLSGHDLVTPRATAKLLLYAAHDPKTGAPQPWFADWKASLPVGGVDGTLADRFTAAPLKGHVFAKTGTHSEGRALSGYLDCASGQTVIFSILVENHLPGDSADRDAMDKIVAAIAAAE
jgi:D-alanyl-D-alanine carboxypeptidase/D-alanyl-D-alanine-endopeptidase (penicillin-binding protein 4)